MSGDHPLNRMSQSMLWGRSDMKEKFYSGSSQSNPWVRDLLWKRVIVEEKKKLNIPLVESVMGAPPFMRSVTMATMKAERELQRAASDDWHDGEAAVVWCSWCGLSLEWTAAAKIPPRAIVGCGARDARGGHPAAALGDG